MYQGGGGESSAASTRLLSAASPHPAVSSLAWLFPLCPRHPAEGAGMGGFPASSHHHLQHHPSKTKVSSSSQMGFPAVIQFSSLVGGWLGSGMA